MISLIAAVAENGAIGKGNQLLWHIVEDLAYFKQVTMGHPVIMGRKTFESIGRALPGRRNIVVSHSKLSLPTPPAFKKDGTPTNTTIEQAEDLNALLKELKRKRTEFFVIGGATLYSAAMPFAKRVYITKIFAEAEGADAFFPKMNIAEWKEISSSKVLTDKENNIKIQFVVYERKS